MSAPSFSSFPPSFSSFPDLEPGPSKTSEIGEAKSRDRTKKEREDESRKETRKKRRKHKSDEGDVKGRSRSGRTGTGDGAGSMTQESARDTSDQHWYSDRKGDSLNVIYGSIHSGNIPRYRLVEGGRRILGLGKGWFVYRRAGKGVEIGIEGGKHKMPTLTDPQSRVLLSTNPTRRLLGSEGGRKYQEVDGFLRLTSRHDRENDQAYRSIANDDRDSASESSDPDGGDSDDDSDWTPTSAHQASLIELERKLNADPGSVPSWLSLLSQTLLTVPWTSKNATKSRSEITLSIIARALSAHPDNSLSTVLRRKYLNAGEEIWHESKLRAEWENALKLGSVEIWMEWLEWRIRRASDGVDGAIEDARRVLAHFIKEEDEIARVRVFWRVAVVLQNGGYPERCMAMFQAQVELTFDLPQAHYSLPLDAQLDALEQFWEAEVPRVGEAGAKGWATFVSPDEPAPPVSRSQTVPQTFSDPYSQWASTELHLDGVCRVPMKSSDETDGESDPYSVVLFSDIRPLLLSLRSVDAKDTLRLAWLSVLGLHVPGFAASLGTHSHDDNTSDRWSQAHLMTPFYLSQIFPPIGNRGRVTADAHAGVLIGRQKEYADVFGPVRNWGHGVLGPLENLGEERAGLWRNEDVGTGGVDVPFVRRVFERLRMGQDDCEWDALALAFEAAINLKGALKLSRSFLESARKSLLHWRSHARLERLRGRPDDARKVYHTVLVASPPAPTAPHVSLMWWDWAEMEWLEGKPDAAAEVIMKAAGITGTSGVSILKAKRSLEDAFRSTGEEQWKEREAWVNLRALLELLMSSVSSAIAVYDAHLGEDCRRHPVADESLTVASLMMVWRYGTVLQSPTSPALLRERADKALQVYPNNTIILGLFLHAQKGQGVWGKVREILGDASGPISGSVPPAKDVSRRVADVWVAGWERSRWEAEIERTRSGLSSAVNNDRTKGSPILWRLFVEFEIRVGQLHRAKKVLFQAIGDCPLNKELYLLAFMPLRSVFEPHELDVFVDAMAGRSIRMRTGLDAILERDRSIAVEEEVAEGSDADGEIEHNARELRRLMPY